MVGNNLNQHQPNRETSEEIAPPFFIEQWQFLTNTSSSTQAFNSRRDSSPNGISLINMKSYSAPSAYETRFNEIWEESTILLPEVNDYQKVDF
jgi:hypothetical protein